MRQKEIKVGDLVRVVGHDKRAKTVGIVAKLTPTLGWVDGRRLSELNREQYTCTIIPKGSKTPIDVRALNLEVIKGDEEWILSEA